jgi:hypothetical protein
LCLYIPIWGYLYLSIGSCAEHILVKQWSTVICCCLSESWKDESVSSTLILLSVIVSNETKLFSES